MCDAGMDGAPGGGRACVIWLRWKWEVSSSGRGRGGGDVTRESTDGGAGKGRTGWCGWNGEGTRPLSSAGLRFSLPTALGMTAGSSSTSIMTARILLVVELNPVTPFGGVGMAPRY